MRTGDWGFDPQELRRRRVLSAARAGVAYASVLAVVLIGVVLPRAEHVWATRAVTRSLASIDPDAVRPVAIAGYAEDSLRFAFRGRPALIGPDEAAAWLEAHPSGLVVIASERGEPATGGFTALDRFRAFNYAGGDALSFVVVERTSPVAALVAVTVTPGSAPPCSSVTVPLIAAVPAWAVARLVPARHATSAHIPTFVMRLDPTTRHLLSP